MHRLRRKLSEPRNAGHRPAASLSIQRRTSTGNSGLTRIIPEMCRTTHKTGKLNLQAKNRQKSRFHRAILPFATETRLAPRSHRPEHPYRANFTAFYDMCCFSNLSESARSPSFLAALAVLKNSDDRSTALERPAR